MKIRLMIGSVLIFLLAASASAQENRILDMITGIEFVLVKGGCFEMGDVFGNGQNDERPVHEVCVSDFYIGRYEVTQGQWTKVMGKNPSSNRTCGASCPVDSVSWNDIQEFINKLNLRSGKQYRLPTEAEWEYAARSGGKKEKWAGTNDEAVLGDYAWYEKNSGGMTHRVGLKKPNALGLYDMSGNVLEWCNDRYDSDYYSVSPKDNPSGPSKGQKRVLRGGIFGRESNELRVTYRSSDDPSIWDGDYGFRLLLPGK